jgi:hypothetical protein
MLLGFGAAIDGAGNTEGFIDIPFIALRKTLRSFVRNSFFHT